jgi:transposase, IS5 family
MQKAINKTSQLLLQTETEVFDSMVEPDNPFRKLNEIVNFTELVAPLLDCYSHTGTKGVEIEKGFKALLIQFWEDYSDRQMEKALRHNIAIRWFCRFSLMEKSPDHSYLGKLRKRIGPEKLAKIFNEVNKLLKEYGLFGNVFHFIDASSIITKTSLWEERDQAIADGEKTLNNINVEKYTADKEARWGAKGKNKYWFGYKRTNSVDMKHGLIEKTALTQANVLDYEVLKNVCPSQGMAFMDKLFDCQEVRRVLQAHRVATGTILKNNNPLKNSDLDKWRTQVRMPFEGVFSKLPKRARYRGVKKMVFQNFFASLVHNLKKAVTILPDSPIPIVA